MWVFICLNCVVQVEFDLVIYFKECLFCVMFVVIDMGIYCYIKFCGVLLFYLNECFVYKVMEDWFGKLWFVFNGLQEYVCKGCKMDGIYVFYWIFDVDMKFSYCGECGIEYCVNCIVMCNGKIEIISEVKVCWCVVLGCVVWFFDDVFVLVLRSLFKKYIDVFVFWDLVVLELYCFEFFVGFCVEVYVVELDEGFVEVCVYMDCVILWDVKFDIGGDCQCVYNVDMMILDVMFKYILLLVWMVVYKYCGEIY